MDDKTDKTIREQENDIRNTDIEKWYKIEYKKEGDVRKVYLAKTLKPFGTKFFEAGETFQIKFAIKEFIEGNKHIYKEVAKKKFFGTVFMPIDSIESIEGVSIDIDEI